MDLFEFFRWALIILLSTTIYWPLTMGLAALAFRVHVGTGKWPFAEDDGFWWRCALASFCLALLSAVVMFVDWLAVSADVPAGIVHLALFMLYLPAGVWILFWSFARDDPGEGLSLLLLYVGLPGVLFVLLALLGVHFPVALAEDWISKTF